MNSKVSVIGIDEVGRGCVAGPIVCASFAIDREVLIQICKTAKEKFQTETKPKQKKLYERLAKLTYYDLKNITNYKLPACAGKQISNYREKDTEEAIQHSVIKNIDILSLVFDSKKVTEKNRNIVAEYLLHFGKWGIGVVSNSIIDTKGIQYANKLAMLKSLSSQLPTNHRLPSTDHHIVLTDHLDPRGIDYKLNNNFELVTSDKMDSKSFVTACASIIAKVYRDNLMGEYHNKYPDYCFNSHVGYGTSTHMQKIRELGLTNIHRKTFLKSFI